MRGGPPALRAASAGVALLLAAVAASGCGPQMAAPPKENPVLADLVDYRSALTMLREGRADEAIAR